jgi:hypothetical protein
MSQVIVHTNENGGVSVTYPTTEFLENNTIEDVLAKDCPDHAIIIDAADLPQGEDEYFNAWELVDGKVVVNQAKKQAMIDEAQAKVDAKAAAEATLAKLGLTKEDLKALIG